MTPWHRVNPGARRWISADYLNPLARGLRADTARRIRAAIARRTARQRINTTGKSMTTTQTRERP